MIRRILCWLGLHKWKALCNVYFNKQQCRNVHYDDGDCLKCALSTKICKYCKEVKK